MVHEIATDLIAEVGDARSVVRQQEKLGVLDGVAGEDVDLAGDGLRHLLQVALRVARPLVIVDARGGRAVDGDVVCHRLIAHRHVAGVECLAECDCRIPLRLDRTDRNAVRVAGANAAIVVRFGVTTRRRRRDEDVVHRRIGAAGRVRQCARYL